MPQRIVVLDGYTLTPAQPGYKPPPGELDWEPLTSLGELIVHDRTPTEEVVAHAQGAPIVLTNKTVIDAKAIQSLPELRYIGVLATGTNIVDLDAARQRGIPVTNVPGYSTASVAQHVFALLLELATHTAAHAQAVREGQWSRCPDFSFTVAPIVELAGKTLGIVGLGAIGKQVARIGHAMGMKIAAAHQSSMRQVDLPGIAIDWMPVDDLFAHADVITLHCPLTDQTRGLVNAQRLGRMKPTAYLINTGRGPLVDESALAEALAQGRLAGAGLDVLSTEPPPPDNPLLGAPRCVITPHIAWASYEARQRLMRIAADNIRAFLDGRAVNVVN
ncbi:MAG TPA: D-2-hydroxyacid dehydrogenase [Phycisphaeraceae bacterium]